MYVSLICVLVRLGWRVDLEINIGARRTTRRKEMKCKVQLLDKKRFWWITYEVRMWWQAEVDRRSRGNEVWSIDFWLSLFLEHVSTYINSQWVCGRVPLNVHKQMGCHLSSVDNSFRRKRKVKLSLLRAVNLWTGDMHVHGSVKIFVWTHVPCVRHFFWTIFTFEPKSVFRCGYLMKSVVV